MSSSEVHNLSDLLRIAFAAGIGDEESRTQGDDDFLCRPLIIPAALILALFLVGPVQRLALSVFVTGSFLSLAAMSVTASG